MYIKDPLWKKSKAKQQKSRKKKYLQYMMRKELKYWKSVTNELEKWKHQEKRLQNKMKKHFTKIKSTSP